VRGFLDDMKDCAEACRVESLFLQGEVGKIVGIVGRIEAELDRSEESIIDRFVPVMRDFHGKANKKIKKINSNMETTLKDYNNLLKYFAVAADEKMQWEDFFLIFDRFAKAYQAAEKQLEEIKERKLKQAKMDAYKDKMQKEKEEQRAAKGKGGDGDNRSTILGKKKKKKKKALVDRVLTSLKKRRDSEFIRMQMLGQVDKAKKIKKKKKKVKSEADPTQPDDGRNRGRSVKGLLGRKKTLDSGKKKRTKKGKSDADLVASIADKMGMQN